MDHKKFNLISRMTGFIVLFIASLTYLLTIEPTTSFWDCGEFIASSYKLEIGHPPGNPVFQLIARFFTIFASPENAAVAVNIMSAMCSAFTIFFLYLTIAHLGRRIIEKSKQELSLSNSIILLGSAVVGSLAYCWSDSFWFSAVEGEVYAMSSLFTAVVFWAMLKWEEQADQEYSNRWIILISFLMGLSIGVHLLNLLAIPALAFIYYYKKYTNFTPLRGLYVLVLSAVILAFILWGIIPFLPKFAAYVDLLFVNVFGLPFNSGALFFMVSLLGLCFGGIYLTYKRKKVLLNTILLCFTMIVIGFSSFAVIVIRSSANPPTNEYQPDNPFTLVRYLGREQYGSNPLVYGETFASGPDDFIAKDYYTPLGDKYHKAKGPLEYSFPSESKMIFPRMWSRSADHIKFYQNYTEDRGKTIPGGKHKMPTFADNLKYFFDFQINWMYMRYFMWNFAGRQNDHHSPAPGNLVSGNWETGIGFLDRARLGDQRVGPEFMVNAKSKNHYYMLPLLLGLIGLFFHLKKDKQNWWVTMLLFLLTGIAIVLYLNQPPYQVRERDYAYAGSFYMFSIWIGLAVMAIFDFLSKHLEKAKIPSHILAGGVVAASLFVPIQMASENWDDHDRSNRYTVRDMAYNYLMSTGENAILVTHGDNDTFPLWYIQEVEGVRKDVRIMNTSLLGTDWYIDQMQLKVNESPKLEFSIPRKDYLYGTNEYPDIIDRFNRPITAKEAITLFKDPRVRVNRYGESFNYFPARTITIPVNVENVKKYGIVSPDDYDKILDTITLVLPESKGSLTKPELMIIDYLSNYQWDRPMYFISQGGDLEFGIENYLQFDGFTYKFVPIKSRTSVITMGQIDAQEMYDRVMNVYRWESLARKDINIDYQNLVTFNGTMNQRNIFVQTAIGLLEDGEKEKAIEVLDKMQEMIIPENFPLNSTIIPSINEHIVLQAIQVYFNSAETADATSLLDREVDFTSGAREKAIDLANRFAEEILLAIELFAQPSKTGFVSRSHFESNYELYHILMEVLNAAGAKEEAKKLEEDLSVRINSLE